MSDFTILYDEPHEADWFRALHPDFADAREASITSVSRMPHVKEILAYDRPDIILLSGDEPVLVIEETVEVPSGHNVGQRFARIAAAAEAQVPSLYFGPYVAKKHGGDTAGPRYMNLRLFHALESMSRTTGSAITTINWPVDKRCEVRRDRAKDQDVREYMEMFLTGFYNKPRTHIHEHIVSSELHGRLINERIAFAQTQIRNPEQYDGPPASVVILGRQDFEQQHGLARTALADSMTEVVRYEVGMNYIRSDPYTGMGILYRYLYTLNYASRALVLWFPNISQDQWMSAAAKGNRKDIRLFRVSADAILFSDGLLVRGGF